MSYALFVPNGILSMAGFDAATAKKGDNYICTHSIKTSRIGEQFKINSKKDIELLEFLSSYGDNFKLFKETSGQ